MKSLNKMTKNERSLLLYLETRAVDYGGIVDTRHMNQDDMEIAKEWNKKGFMGFGRIVMKYHSHEGTHWCKFSDEAWKLAHQERKNRNERLWLKRDWLGTEESREVFGNPHTSGLNKDINLQDEV